MTTMHDDIFTAMWDAPFSKRGWISITARGLTISGIDHNKLSAMDVTNVPGLGQVLTFHEAGGTHWTGRGMKRSHHPAQVHVVLIQAANDHSFRFVGLASPNVAPTVAAREDRDEQITQRLATIATKEIV